MKSKLAGILILLLVAIVAVGGVGVYLYAKDAAQTTESQADQLADDDDGWEDGSDTNMAPGAEHVYSHRGASGEAPEHTFQAYDLAIEEGSINIEQDLVISADGTLYVAHDRNARALTGVDKEYNEMTNEEIDELRTHGGDRILKLSEVFDRYGQDVNYIIELKKRDDATVAAFKEIVDQYQMADNVVVQCFSLSILEDLDECYPDMPKLYLVDNQKALEEGLDKTYVDIIGANKKLMTAENVDAVHEASKDFAAWVLDTEDEIKEAIDLNVDEYFTNYTSRALEIEKEYRNEN
ncbi:MAG: glycerophosphodiester phosphodiesterase [Eubacterium sp.]|nr:glycerophosphodiester phosphodiesterase [Candidatus Colimonas fimequi]